MNSRTLITLIIIILVVLGGYFLLSNRVAAPENEVASLPESTPVEGTIVTYTDGGYSPSVITIAMGDTVTFVNNSGSGMWTASDEHPTHTSYDGTATREHCSDGVVTNGTFDACQQVAPGDSWTYTFTKSGSFDYHNHARASHGGTIVVQ